MPLSDYRTYYPGSITRIVHILARSGIKSREDLMARYDVDTPSYEAIKGIGPVLSELLVWLRGQTLNGWRELTGLPVFSDKEQEAQSYAEGSGPLPTADQDWS